MHHPTIVCTGGDNFTAKENPVDILHLGFRKAFDAVPHRQLLDKVAAYGIDRKLLRWITAFLIGRQQRVTINGTSSRCTPVRSGIP